jgi:enamine deaminase RidA (YjgF/YER057c/UK114 family)
MPQTERTTVVPTGTHKPLGRYSHAVRVKGEVMFLSGIVGVDEDGELVGKGDAGAQVRQIFKNMEAILSSVGATFNDVLEWTTYVVGREAALSNQKVKVELFAKLFPNGGEPASTMVIVDGLAHDDFLVEIRAVAAVP